MSVIQPGRNLVLIGMMGAGKTVVGRILAMQLGRPFVDTDALVEQAANCSITQIFAEQGERAFRRLESEAVRRASALRGQVVAVGGGAALDPVNLTALRATGDLVLLEASPEQLAARAGDAGKRPLLRDFPDPVARIEQLLAERRPTYLDWTATVVETDEATPEQVADAVLRWARTQPGLLAREELDE